MGFLARNRCSFHPSSAATPLALNGGHKQTGIPWYLQRNRRCRAVSYVVW